MDCECYINIRIILFFFGMAVYKCYFYLHDNELSFLAGWVKEALCHETEKGGNRA